MGSNNRQQHRIVRDRKRGIEPPEAAFADEKKGSRRLPHSMPPIDGIVVPPQKLAGPAAFGTAPNRPISTAKKRDALSARPQDYCEIDGFGS